MTYPHHEQQGYTSGPQPQPSYVHQSYPTMSPAPHYPQPYYPMPYPPAQPNNGMATGGMVLGIIAVILSVFPLPFTLLPALICAIVGITLSVVARRRYLLGEAPTLGHSTVGITLNSIALGIIVLWMILLVIIFSTLPAMPAA